ncbi:MAG: hypothetical protein CMB99_09060 [Flavobacteriaceae bacterium]|nr:hypothetical protein [Flavobacteriaceae bacterium]|tara:strand:+ start:526646 stop:528115 length:1470 start_codon:yes stop_codon:yes gene_type:complete
MNSHFLRLEWKQYFRSSYWQTGIALKVIMVFFALYFLVSFLALGIGSFFLIRKLYPDSDPLQVVNTYLVFAFLGDLVFRYLMQKIPIMNIKPLLILDIKKKSIVHFILTKSAFSFFNVMPLFFYIPFAIVLVGQGYNGLGVTGWFFTMLFLTLFNNYVNFLINKNQKIFFTLATILAALCSVQYFGVYDVASAAGPLFDAIYAEPIWALVPLVLVVLSYNANFNYLKTRVYLDDAVKKDVKEVKSVDLSWTDRFGEVAPFLRNDIRLIWRNKRPRTVFLLSFVFIAYALIFFTQEVYEQKMPVFLIFAALFVTGGFVMNFGQFIPAWDSAYYKMIMSQNIKYRLFLESKWYLMVVMTFVLYLLSIPYIYFGLDKFLMITAGAIYNIGFNSILLLYAGSFNRKRIDLDKSAFANYQGTSATQFIVIIPILALPMLLFWIFKTTISFNAGILSIAVVGLLTLVFKKYLMNFIEKKYIQDKYAAIHAFDQTT